MIDMSDVTVTGSDSQTTFHLDNYRLGRKGPPALF